MGRIDYESETLIAHSLKAEGFDASEDGTGRGTPLVPVHAVYFQDDVILKHNAEVVGALRREPGGKGACVAQHMAVRRLTPRECCRLQGFHDDYLDIVYRKKPAADGPKYKALGNSMAVPVMAWIGRRIQIVEDLPLC